jgi:hypothetical protein
MGFNFDKFKSRWMCENEATAKSQPVEPGRSSVKVTGRTTFLRSPATKQYEDSLASTTFVHKVPRLNL